MSKKILIIAPQSFPPLYRSGSIRNSKYVKYLSKYGFKIEVLKDVDNTNEIIDKELAEETAGICEVTEIDSILSKLRGNINSKLSVTKKGENKKFFSLRNILVGFVAFLKRAIMVIIRFLLFIPDEYIIWVIYAYKFVIKKYKDEEFDIVLSSGPPFSAHILGFILKKKYDIFWIADFRDKWMDHIVFNPKTFYRRIIEKYLEKIIVKKSDLLITATEPITNYFKETYKNYRIKMHTISNGFDKSDFDAINNSILDKKYFNIVYTGAIGGYLNPDTFIKAFLELENENTELFKNTRLTFAGKLLEDSSKYFYGENRNENINYIGFLNHKNAISLMKEADALLLIIYDQKGGETIMCGKFYEYLAIGKPIIALIPRGVAYNVIEENGLGYISSPNNLKNTKANIEKSYIAWKSNTVIHYRVDTNLFTREYQINLLYEIINEKLNIN